MEPQIQNNQINQLIQLSQDGDRIAVIGQPTIESVDIVDTFEFKTKKKEGNKMITTTYTVKVVGLETSSDFERFSLDIGKMQALAQALASDPSEEQLMKLKSITSALLAKYTDFNALDKLSAQELSMMLTSLMNTSLVQEFVQLASPDSEKKAEGAVN